MLTKILIISIIALFGVIVGLNFQPAPSPNTFPNLLNSSNNTQLFEKIKRLQAQIDQLENKLIEDRIKQKNTLNQLAKLSQRIEETQGSKSDVNDQTDEVQLDEHQSSFDVSEPRITESEKNKAILLTMGIENDTAIQIQRKAEKKEMDQLYLRNTAAREGWFGTEKYFKKTRELDLKSNIYRDSLGDEKYDQFLYASQQTNRITVQSVLSESPAEIAGLQTGDYIISYDNKRVFNWSDLTSLTAEGEVGESIPVEIKRNGQFSQIYITRGPLGIRLNSERVQPASQN